MVKERSTPGIEATIQLHRCLPSCSVDGCGKAGLALSGHKHSAVRPPPVSKESKPFFSILAIPSVSQDMMPCTEVCISLPGRTRLLGQHSMDMKSAAYPLSSRCGAWHQRSHYTGDRAESDCRLTAGAPSLRAQGMCRQRRPTLQARQRQTLVLLKACRLCLQHNAHTRATIQHDRG